MRSLVRAGHVELRPAPGLTGTRYNVVEKTLYIDSRVGDFRSFLSTATGFGTVGLNESSPAST